MEVDDFSDTTGWFDMPFEMRETIISYMDVPTKIQFSQCSKLCFEEAQLFDSSYFSIKIRNNPSGEKKGVIFEMMSNHMFRGSKDASKTYQVITMFLVCDIPNISEGELMNIRSLHALKYRLIEVETREKVVEYVMYLLRGITKYLKNCLKSLTIHVPDFPYNKLKIEKELNALESIHISRNDQINPVSCGFIDIEQLSSMKKIVEIPNLTIDQIFPLKAKTISIVYDGNEQFDIEQFVYRLFSDKMDRNVSRIDITPKKDLDDTAGIYAKRDTPRAVDYLFKHRGKIIRIECPKYRPQMSILLRSPIDFDESEWTIL
ncbi:unnamed protein product [Caenorhabditis angaria]|uniref:F-box domain-containing protein n=1 Tax=Caenorhabditis angaria TaxID=860376 RepID=A0A9P1MVW4_9PELO|nr:unnamed protein product [Caenorhabditis angaria]